MVGIGALKYADLSQNRSSDYKFSYDKMLALRGNTATYLQYSYARVQGIIRKTEADVEAIRANPSPFEFEKEVERQLGVKLIRFGEALDEVLVEYKPNILCNYLFELSQLFAQFFDQCSVKDAGSESLQNQPFAALRFDRPDDQDRSGVTWDRRFGQNVDRYVECMYSPSEGFRVRNLHI